jgi:hypothetical protein
VITPVAGHVPCELDQQRRLAEARADTAARRARGPRRSRVLIGRGGARNPSPRGYANLDLARRGEDVWRALRF